MKSLGVRVANSKHTRNPSRVSLKIEALTTQRRRNDGYTIP